MLVLLRADLSDRRLDGLACRALRQRLGQLGESDYPYDPFWIEMPADWPLTPEMFREVLGFEESREIVMWPVSSPQGQSPTSYEEVLAAAVYDNLLRQMQATLSDLTEVLARGDNIVQVPYFLFGRLNGGNLVGLRSISVET